MRGSGAAVLHAPARDRAAIVGLRFGTRRRDAAEGSLLDISDVHRYGRVLRYEQQGGTVSMEVEGPADVVERRRRDGRGRESRCS